MARIMDSFVYVHTYPQVSLRPGGNRTIRLRLFEEEQCIPFYRSLPLFDELCRNAYDVLNVLFLVNIATSTILLCDVRNDLRWRGPCARSQMAHQRWSQSRRRLGGLPPYPNPPHHHNPHHPPFRFLPISIFLLQAGRLPFSFLATI